MRPTQNTTIHVLLAAAVLLAMVLLYWILAQDGQPMLTPAGWLVFGGAALTLVLAAFLPSLVRRWKGLPAPQPLSSSEIRICIAVAGVGCIFAVVGVFFEIWWLMALGIMLAPLSFMFRSDTKPQRAEKS
jgi:hypothetical protein